MKRLSKSEEIAILRELAEREEFIANGSSRAVFEWGDDQVVKVAYDNPGRIQNHQEIEAARMCPHLTAEIEAYGSNIIICEKLEDSEIFDLVEFMDSIDAYDEDGYSINYVNDEDYEELTEYGVPECLERMLAVYNEANRELGYTEDNCQIGWSESRQKYVLFDAGFRGSDSSDRLNVSQVGCLNDMRLCIHDLTNGLYDIIDGIKHRSRRVNNYLMWCDGDFRDNWV